MNNIEAIKQNIKETAQEILESKDGIYFLFSKDSKTIILMIVTESLNKLKKFAKDKNSLYFVFEDEKGEFYKIKELNTKEKTLFNIAKDIHIFDMENFSNNTEKLFFYKIDNKKEIAVIF